MIQPWLIDAFDNYWFVLAVFMGTELFLLEVLLHSVLTRNAALLAGWIFNELGAFIAYFTHLADFVGAAGLLVADEFNLVGETLLEVMRADGGEFMNDYLG